MSGSSVTTRGSQAVYLVLVSLSAGHFINDLVQALLPALYPMLKADFGLSFWQIGLITLTSHLTASVLQPIVGYYTDRRPQPYSLTAGMVVTLAGVLLLSIAGSFAGLLVSSALVGVGSSVFHPESSRVARLASGGQHGLAQSLFQTGGNAGSALGPLLAAVVVVPRGQSSIAWFSAVAALGVVLLWRVGVWYRHTDSARVGATRAPLAAPVWPSRPVRRSLAVLVALVFSKYVYLSSLTTYLTFYLMHRFGVSLERAEVHLFAFLAAVTAGTFIGGPVGDRIGRKAVIWASIFGVLPFTLVLPYVDLFWTTVLSLVIGFVLASAFSAILVFAQDLMPGQVGLVAGLFFGFAFGAGGIGAALLGRLADVTSIEFTYRVCAFLPLIGLLAAWLPDLKTKRPGLAPDR